jgi:hypothetical protein
LKVAPPLLPGGEVNAVLIRSGECRAFQNVVQELYFMAHPPPKVQPQSTSTEYPALTDDRAWNDGLKLVPLEDEIPEPPK